MAPAFSSSVTLNVRNLRSRAVESYTTVPPKKNAGNGRKNTTKEPAAKKKLAAKKNSPKKKQTKKTNVVVAPVPLQVLPDIINPDNKQQLLDLFASFGVVARQKMIYSIVDVDGITHDLKKRHSSNMIRLMAAQVIHFSVYGTYRISKEHLWSRCVLCDFDALWNPFRRTDLLSFINDLNRKFVFLNKHETPEGFVTIFKCGATQQHFRNQFVSPKSDPVGWFQDGHTFNLKRNGLHVSLKPFFKALCIYIEKNAYGGELDDQSLVLSEDESL